jgi:hypothetical protein
MILTHDSEILPYLAASSQHWLELLSSCEHPPLYFWRLLVRCGL